MFPATPEWPGIRIMHESGNIATNQLTYETRPRRRVGESKMDNKIAYCKPNIIALGRAEEMISGTLVKGPTGVSEAIQSRILPAYDLDE
jgi:hypothetical protein